MNEQYLLAGNVLWSYDHELEEADIKDELRALVSFVPPIHHHQGEIALTNGAIRITGDADLVIPLKDIEQLALDFDETFKRSYVKNGGMFWQPLKIKFTDYSGPGIVYLIIDYSWLGVKNQLWFEQIKAVLS